MKLFNAIAASIFFLAPVSAIAQQATMPANVKSEENSVDITETQVDAMYDLIGGKRQYYKMTAWAANNLSEDQIQAFNTTIETGQYSRKAAAIEWLIQAYQARSSTNSNSEIVNARVKPSQTMSDTPFFWNR